ncbi:hypothetical protein [uncultured Dysosmobacter sp.]|uniref:hypothetical protein n=1 Tax=uncultured Dysosmobacter sp. TaxID=2591384 RepID=UPI0026284774|nr:hypothetical protein [uncultured Dysosmobacter sp.]
MKHYRLQHLIYMALCCNLGLLSKRLIAPVTNIFTDALHIPGGIGTSFSLMFLVICAAVIPRFGCAAIMGIVQSVLALSMGMVGSMGALSPIGYIVPGMVIDGVLYLSRKVHLSMGLGVMIANMLAAAAAAITANVIVFHLGGIVLALYLAVAVTSGAICGMLAGELVPPIRLALAVI